MIVHAFTLLALLCRLLQKYPHLHQLNHLPEIWWTVPKAYQDLPPDGPLPWRSDNFLFPLQSLHCLLHNSKKKSIFASSISFNCKSTVFLFRNWPFYLFFRLFCCHRSGMGFWQSNGVRWCHARCLQKWPRCVWGDVTQLLYKKGLNRSRLWLRTTCLHI